jgi:hypothetical protein
MESIETLFNFRSFSHKNNYSGKERNERIVWNFVHKLLIYTCIKCSINLTNLISVPSCKKNQWSPFHVNKQQINKLHTTYRHNDLQQHSRADGCRAEVKIDSTTLGLDRPMQAFVCSKWVTRWSPSISLSWIRTDWSVQEHSQYALLTNSNNISIKIS